MTATTLEFVPSNPNLDHHAAASAAALWERVWRRRDLIAINDAAPALNILEKGNLTEYRHRNKTWFSAEPDGALRTRHHDPEVVVAMVRRFQSEGQTSITVQGSTRFRQRAWTYGQTLGLTVNGYEPSARDHDRVAYLRAHRALIMPDKPASAPEERSKAGTEPVPREGTPSPEPKKTDADPKPSTTAPEAPGAFTEIKTRLVDELDYLHRYQTAGRYERITEGYTPATKMRARQQAAICAKILTTAGEPFSPPDRLIDLYKTLAEERLQNQVLPIGLGTTPSSGATAGTILSDLNTLAYWDKANRSEYVGFNEGFRHQLGTHIEQGLMSLVSRDREMLEAFVRERRKDLVPLLDAHIKAITNNKDHDLPGSSASLTTKPINIPRNDSPIQRPLAPVDRHPAVKTFRDALARLEPSRQENMARIVISYPEHLWMERARRDLESLTGGDVFSDPILDTFQAARALPDDLRGRVIVHDLGKSRVGWALIEERSAQAFPEQMVEQDTLWALDYRDEQIARFTLEPTPEIAPSRFGDPFWQVYEPKEPMEPLIARIYFNDPELLREMTTHMVAYGPDHLEPLEQIADPSMPDLLHQLRSDDFTGTNTLLRFSEMDPQTIFEDEWTLNQTRQGALGSRLELTMMARAEHWLPTPRQPSVAIGPVVTWFAENRPEDLEFLLQQVNNGDYAKLVRPCLLDGPDRFYRDELVAHLHHDPLGILEHLDDRELLPQRPAGMPEYPDHTPLIPTLEMPERNPLPPNPFDLDQPGSQAAESPSSEDTCEVPEQLVIDDLPEPERRPSLDRDAMTTPTEAEREEQPAESIPDSPFRDEADRVVDPSAEPIDELSTHGEGKRVEQSAEPIDDPPTRDDVDDGIERAIPEPSAEPISGAGRHRSESPDDQLTIDFEPIESAQLDQIAEMLAGHLETLEADKTSPVMATRARDQAAMIIGVLEESGVNWETIRARTPDGLRDMLQGNHGSLPPGIPDQPGDPLERARRTSVEMDRALLEQGDLSPDDRQAIATSYQATAHSIDHYEIQETLFSPSPGSSAKETVPRQELRALRERLDDERAMVRETKPKTLWSRRAERVVGVLGRVLEANGEEIPKDIGKLVSKVKRIPWVLDPETQPCKTAVAMVFQADLVLQTQEKLLDDQTRRMAAAHAHHAAQLGPDKAAFLQTFRHTAGKPHALDAFGRLPDPDTRGILIFARAGRPNPRPQPTGLPGPH